mmetsp:Transcript_1390/g.2484  ORF Transcript_1390/g.2484 Transcript_1390/m.2484 type:complete len:332 (+) Transcript_1390:690-1685(+)
MNVGGTNTLDRGLERLAHHILGDNGLDDDRLATTFNPVNGGWLFIRAHVSTECHQKQRGKFRLEQVNDGQTALGDHIHAHGVSRETAETKVNVATGHCGIALFEFAKTGGGLKGSLEFSKMLGFLAPILELGRFHGRLHAHAGCSGNAITDNATVGAATLTNGLGSPVGTGHQTSLRGGHGHIYRLIIQGERSHHSHRQRHVSHDNFTIGPKDPCIIQRGPRGQLIERSSTIQRGQLRIKRQTTHRHGPMRIQNFLQHVILHLVAHHQLRHLLIRHFFNRTARQRRRRYNRRLARCFAITTHGRCRRRRMQRLLRRTGFAIGGVLWVVVGL